MSDNNSEENFKVVLTGFLKSDVSLAEVEQRLSKLLKTTPEKVGHLLQGRPTIIKHNLTSIEADRYCRAIEKTGALCQLEPVANIAAACSKSALTLVEIDPPLVSSKLSSLVLDKPMAFESPATPPNKCPKCGYQARCANDTIFNKNACPACGLMIVRYLEFQEELERKKHLNELPKASIKDRVLASLYTSFSSTLLFCPAIPIAALIAVITFRINLSEADRVLLVKPKLFSNRSVEMTIQASVTPWLAPNHFSVLRSELNFSLGYHPYKEAADKAKSAEIITKFLFGGLVIWYVLVWRPLKNWGQTIGQEWAGLRVINRQGQTEHSMLIYLRRLLGHLCVFPTGFISLLLPLTNSDRKSFGDLLSNTTQVQEDQQPDHPRQDLFRAWEKSALAGFLAFVFSSFIIHVGMPTATSGPLDKPASRKPLSFSEWMLGDPPDRKKIDEAALARSAERSAKLRDFLMGEPLVLNSKQTEMMHHAKVDELFRETLLKRIAKMQQRHYQNEGHYSDDAMVLVGLYGSEMYPKIGNQLAMAMEMSASVQLRQITNGFEAGYYLGNDQWQIVTNSQDLQIMRCNPIKGTRTDKLDNCYFTLNE